MCAEDGGTKGNISANPKFVSPTNFEVKNNSPAVDAGTIWPLICLRETLPASLESCTGDIDMGAYENQKVSAESQESQAPALPA